MIKINKHEIIKYGLIASLLANFTLGGRYVVDSKEYKGKIKHLTSEVKSLDNDKQFLLIEFWKRIKNIKELQGKVDLLTNENNVIKNELNKTKEENKKLKKQLIARKEMNKKRKLNMQLTFYGADCNGCSGITKSGISVKNTVYYKNMRVIAADPRVIKLHSIIKIETKNESYYGYVADTGGAIKGNILDVLVSSERESYKHGRQQATVTILREGKG